MDPFHNYNILGYDIEWYLILLAWSAIALGSHFYQVGFVVRLIRLGKDDARDKSCSPPEAA